MEYPSSAIFLSVFLCCLGNLIFTFICTYNVLGALFELRKELSSREETAEGTVQPSANPELKLHKRRKTKAK